MARDNLSWDFCCHSPAIPHFTQLARKIPHMQFILDHCKTFKFKFLSSTVEFSIELAELS